MRLDKVLNRVKYQDSCQKLILQESISRQKFYDFSLIQNEFHCKDHIWYSYQKYYKFQYLDLKNTSNTKYFYYKNQLKQLLQNKYEYYKKYQQECSDINVIIVINELAQLQVMGHFYKDYQQNFVCITKNLINNSQQFVIMSNSKFVQFLDKNHFQTIKEKPINIRLKKDEIYDFLNNTIQSYINI